MLSAGTLMSLEIIMFPWNKLYCEHDSVCRLSIYLIVCVQKSILFYSIFSFYYLMYVCRYLDVFQKKKTISTLRILSLND
jgi:hypothetical protein